MKQLKKLVLRKETIVNLNNSEMNELKGGDLSTGVLLPCAESYANCTLDNCKQLGHTEPPRCCAYGCCETIGC